MGVDSVDDARGDLLAKRIQKSSQCHRGEQKSRTLAPGMKCVVDTFDKMFEMSAWLGQHYHHFDAISTATLSFF
jgi:hypothetical protein